MNDDLNTFLAGTKKKRPADTLSAKTKEEQLRIVKWEMEMVENATSFGSMLVDYWVDEFQELLWEYRSPSTMLPERRNKLDSILLLLEHSHEAIAKYIGLRDSYWKVCNGDDPLGAIREFYAKKDQLRAVPSHDFFLALELEQWAITHNIRLRRCKRPLCTSDPFVPKPKHRVFCSRKCRKDFNNKFRVI